MDSESTTFNSDVAYTAIRTLVVEAALYFHSGEVHRNHLSGATTTVRQEGMRLRDALIYRFESILYHLDILRSMQASAERRLHDPRVMRDPHDHLRSAIQQQRFVFDDLVFNSVAFFDYFGRFAAVLLQADASIKLRWDKLYKWAKHADARTGINHIHGTALAPIVVMEDQSWLRKLTEYRSNVIHYEAAKLDGSVEFSFTRAPDGSFTPGHTIQPRVPTSFLKALKIRTGDKPVPITKAAELLVSKVTATGEEVLRALAKDLEARVPALPEGAVLSEPTFAKRRK